MTRCALLFVLAASGRNTTQGARRRTHASEGIAGYAETPLRGSRKSRLPSLPSLIRAEDDAFRAFVAVEVFGGDQANGPATRGRVGSRSPSPGAPDFFLSAAGPPARFFGVFSRRRSASATRWPRPSHHAAESPEAPDEALAKESSFTGARRLANVSEGEARETAGLGFTHLVTLRAPLGRGRVRSMAMPMASRPTSPGSFSEAVRARVFFFVFFFGSRSPSPGAPDFVFSAAGPPARFFGVLSRRRSALATRWPRPSHHAAESPEAPDEALAKESSFPGARRLANVSEGEARETAGLGFTHLVTLRAPLGRGRVRSMAMPMASRPTSPGSFSEAVRARVFFFVFFSEAKETPPNGAVHQASVSDSSEDDSSFAANGARPREETASPGFFRGAFVSVSVVFFSVFSFSGGAHPSKETAFARESEGRVFEIF